MAAPALPKPVKYFVAALWNDSRALSAACELLAQTFGSIDFQGTDHPFDSTSYYESEMGRDLKRRLITFADLRSPEQLAPAKLRCNQIEEELALSNSPAHGRSGFQRTINLDVGYLDHNKIVLASAKGLGQKIYLSQGIYADLVARFGHGRYQPFEWTFPDFKTGRYDAELETIRKHYLERVRDL
jgi:hypothetical protein